MRKKSIYFGVNSVGKSKKSISLMAFLFVYLILAFHLFSSTFSMKNPIKQIESKEIVPINLAISIATKKAQMIWKEVRMGNPITAYYLSGNPSAYIIPFRIGRGPFPGDEKILNEIRFFQEKINNKNNNEGIIQEFADSYLSLGNLEEAKERRWGANEYGYIIISATWDRLPIQEYSKSLPFYYTQFDSAVFLVKKNVGIDFKMTKLIFYGPFDKLFEFANENKTILVTPFNGMIYDKELLVDRIKINKATSDDHLAIRNEWEKWISNLNSPYVPLEESENQHWIENRPQDDVVPRYLWTCGCTPTAAMMVLGYYDWHKPTFQFYQYGLLVERYMEGRKIENNYFDANGDTYTFGYPEENDTIPMATIYELARAMDCLAMKCDAMGCTGGVEIGPGHYSIRDGIIEVTNKQKGYNFVSFERVTGGTYFDPDPLWEELKYEIDNDRPCIWSCDKTIPFPSFAPGHSVCVVGYTDNNYIICHDTSQYPYITFPYKNNGQTFVDLTTVIPYGGKNSDIEVIVPDGGEIWESGKDFKITWLQEGYDIDNVEIFYSTDGGYSYDFLASSNSSQGFNYYNWSIPFDVEPTESAFVWIQGWKGTDELISRESSRNQFTIIRNQLELNINTCQLDKPTYYSGENASLSVNVQDNNGNFVEGANVSYVIKDINDLVVKNGTCADNGNGNYEKTFNVDELVTTGTFNVEVTASKTGYLSGSCTTFFDVINRWVGHNLRLDQFYTYQTSYQPGNWASFSMQITNIGDFPENVTATLTVTGPNGYFYTKDENKGTLSPNYSTGIFSISWPIPSNAPHGNYTVKGKASCPSGDEDFSDNTKTVTVSVYDNPPGLIYRSYKYETKVLYRDAYYQIPYWNYQGGWHTTWSANGNTYKIEIGAYVYAGDGTVEKVGMNVYKNNDILPPGRCLVGNIPTCYTRLNHSNYYDNYNLMLFDFFEIQTGGELAFYISFAAPTNNDSITISPLEAFTKVGQPVNFQVNVPYQSYNSIRVWNCNTNDQPNTMRGQVLSYFSHPGSSYGPFTVTATPTAIDQGTNFAVIVSGSNSHYLLFGKLLVEHSYDARISNITINPSSPRSGTIATITNTVENIGSGSLTGIEVYTTITGPGNYYKAFSTTTNGGNVPFSWDTLGCLAGVYSINTTISHPNDPNDSNNSMNKTVTLGSPPVLVVSAATDNTSYCPGKTVTVSITVSDDGGVPLPGVFVTCSVIKDNTVIYSAAAGDNGNGNYSIGFNAPGSAGDYILRTQANHPRYISGQTETTFSVMSCLPEIIIKKGDTEIPPDEIVDFGKKDIDSDTDITFTIGNTGKADLTLYNLPITIFGTDDDQFSVEQQPAVSLLEPGNSTSFVIRFTPTTQGTKTAFISLANNDLDKNPYRINLTGVGYIDPLITNISPSSGPVGIRVTISGSNFGSTAGSVTFDGLEAQIESWSETEIVALVPNKAGTGPVIVRTQAGRKSNETTFTVNDGNLFVDNFESYIPGMFPILSGWQLINPGWGDQYQVIDTSNYNSPGKSFKLEGSSTSPATVVHEYQLPYGNPDGVYCQFWVKVTRLENPITLQPDFMFWAGKYGTYSYNFGSIEFRLNPTDGKEYLFFNDQIGPEVNLGQWYNIKVKYDLLDDTGDVWINNAMVFSQVALGSNSTHYFEPAVTFEGGNDCHTRVWIDDITVYMYMEDSTLTVTSPNGGESWEVGSSQEITWESTGKKGDVKIEYSTNNRASWKSIVTSAANDGSYLWTIPNSPSKNCLIRVSDMDGGLSDVSNREFSIVLPPSITITSPNGGERWKAGNSYNIAWTSTGPVGNVKIEYSINNGTSWTVITSSTTNDGSYMWTAAGTAAGNCLIRVSETDGYPSDVSDGVFSIVEPSSLTITSPNGGESWEVGSSHNITWTSSGTVGKVIIEYSTNGGSSWRNIVTLTGNSNNYLWKVPDTPSKNCKVRIRENNTDESAADVSDAVFSIVSPSSATVKVTSPNGGESLLVGSSHEITWTTTGTIANIKIELSTNSGTSWAEITASTPNDGSYDWMVPGNPSVNCLIRVSETDGNPADVSDTVFSIVAEPDPTITLTSPNGGENLIAGSTHDITWNTTATVENVLIEYSTNSGESWEKIVTSTANDGSYNWTVPETPSENCLVRIRASDGDKGPSDISDAVFSIASLSTAAIKVTSPNGGEILTIGSTHEITWTSTGTVGDVKIEYSTDRGTSWTGIVTSATNNGTFNWTVPNDPSSTCLVRISENDTDGGPFDISDKAFSMVSPSSGKITVTSPNGGERLEVGGAFIITWTSIGTVENVKIEYSLDSGSSWMGIISSTPNDGMYEWIVPGNPSENCLIRVSEIDGDPSDISDGEFSIVLPSSIEVTSPNGDESWEVFSSQNITWTSSGTVGNVMIEYSTDRGTSWTNIVTATENDGSYDWTVPDNPSYYCLVRISESGTDTGPSDVSNAEFSIIPPSSPVIAVTYPNGGENLYVNSTYEITWADTGSIGDIRIEYSINGGTSWTEIIACISDNGSFDWTVPDNPSENCLIRVSETDGNPVDVSDAEFSIVSPSTATILVSSPNGGESLAANSTHEITWTSTGAIDKVLIEYSTDEGTSWTNIATTTDNDGSYIWKVPGTPSDKCLVRISGNDADESPSDVSNAVFEITAELNPTITVTSPNGVENLIIGSIHEITWTSTGTINNVMIEYSTDNGATWTGITTFTPNSGRYDWTVPDTPSDTCLIRITGNDSDDAPSDVSDVIFSIIPETSS